MRDSRVGGGRGLALAGYALFAVVLATLLSSCVGGVADPGQWLALTPSDQNTVLTLADDPFDTDFIYAGTSAGLVYRAYAANRSDGVAGTGIPSDVVVSSLAADTKTVRLIYAGTSDGFYVSTDRGDHWALRGSGLPSGDAVDAMVVSTPANVLFAGTTSHGIYASSDQGQTWSAVRSGLPANANINALLWEPLSQTLFAAVDGVGVFASVDGGATWTSRSSGLSAHPLALVAREPSTVASTATPSATTSPTSPATATIYVGTDTGVFASADGGQNWTSLGFAHRAQALALDPQHPTWMYAGTESDVYRTQNDGASWASLAPGVSHSVTALLSVLPTGQATVLYAGAGQLLRFPPYPSGSNSSPILGTFMLILLCAAVGFVFYRTRLRMIEADRRLPLGLQPETVKKEEEDSSPGPVDIDQYMSMMRAPTPQDAERGGADSTNRPDDMKGIEN